MTETICTCWKKRDDEWALERVTCPSHGVAALRRAAAASVATEAPRQQLCPHGVWESAFCRCVDCKEAKASEAPPPQTATWWLAAVEGNGAEVFYVPVCGWASTALDYHEGIGPYFSLPEALRRLEAQNGEAAWKPRRLCIEAQTEEPHD